MRRELDLDKVKAPLAKLFGELRGNRLWPIAIVLLAAIVAVPIALSKSSGGTPVAAAPSSTPASPQTALPALNVQAQANQSRLRGHGRDPFAQPNGGHSPATTATAGAAGATTTTAAGLASGAGSSSPTGTGATGGSTGSGSALPTSTNTSPPSITPSKKPTPAPSGLTSTEAYDVSLAMTNASGGLDTTDPLERLSVLPSPKQPMLVELGVAKGGGRVLFAVHPGTVVGGPGGCTPGPIDCQVLSLGQDQTESLSVQSPAGPVQVALFAVTGISAQRFSSAAAAGRARRAESQAGRDWLNAEASTLDALSLFQYDAGTGAEIDLRNLTAQDK